MVLALVIASTFIVLLLGVLVAGLLRSHADILQSLHDLGVGVGDPSRPDTGGPAPVPVAGPSTSQALGIAPPVAGVTPGGDARAVAMGHGSHLTLLAFLSTGCATCAGFWSALQRPDALALPEHVRVVIVTKGPDREVPSEVAAQTTGRVPVVMSTEAWLEYEVPGSPFFVLVDGARGKKVGQGVASAVTQLTELVRRAEHDRGGDEAPPHLLSGVDGPARAADLDETLRAAGIPPGHSSLYPRSIDDVFPFGRTEPADGPVDQRAQPSPR